MSLLFNLLLQTALLIRKVRLAGEESPCTAVALHSSQHQHVDSQPCFYELHNHVEDLVVAIVYVPEIFSALPWADHAKLPELKDRQRRKASSAFGV
jgi:hypothetical protein